MSDTSDTQNHCIKPSVYWCAWATVVHNIRTISSDNQACQLIVCLSVYTGIHAYVCTHVHIHECNVWDVCMFAVCMGMHCVYMWVYMTVHMYAAFIHVSSYEFVCAHVPCVSGHVYVLCVCLSTHRWGGQGTCLRIRNSLNTFFQLCLLWTAAPGKPGPPSGC